MVDNILFERFPWKPAWHTYAKALIKDAANKWARMGNTPIELPTPLELSRDIIKYADYPLANSLQVKI